MRAFAQPAAREANLRQALLGAAQQSQVLLEHAAPAGLFAFSEEAPQPLDALLQLHGCVFEKRGVLAALFYEAVGPALYRLQRTQHRLEPDVEQMVRVALGKPDISHEAG